MGDEITRIQVRDIQRAEDAEGGYINGRVIMLFGRGAEISVTTSVEDHPEGRSLPEIESALLDRSLQLLGKAHSLEPAALSDLRNKGRRPSEPEPFHFDPSGLSS